MVITSDLSDERLFQRYRRDGDHAAFEALCRRYTSPSGDGLLDWDGESLLDWVICKHQINGFDADDIVADCWADLIINQPDVCESFSAFAYQKLQWLVADYWGKRIVPKSAWPMPWRAKTNYFLPPGAKPSTVIRQAEDEATCQDARVRARQRTHFLHLAIMQEAIACLPAEEQQAIQLYWLEDLTIEEAAQAAGTTFASFRLRKERALKRLRHEFFRIRHKVDTPEDQETLLNQWGDVRTDLHWVPDGENQECDCSRCKKSRRESTFHGIAAPEPDSDCYLIARMNIYMTDHDGYKLPGKKMEGTLFRVGNDMVIEPGAYDVPAGWRYIDTYDSCLVA